jgi:hypothetical protein
MRRATISIVLALAAAGSGSVLPAAAIADVPGTNCEMFPADNAWHLNVSGLPVHGKNEVWKRSSNARRTLLHPDFGPPAYGIPFDIVGADHSTVDVDFRYASESDRGPYPFGPDISVEGGSDRHALMVDRSTCVLYELFAARWNDGAPTAGSGAVFRLEGARANDLRPAGWTSADAAGLPILPGLLTPDEVEAGRVDHAIRFTVGCTSDRYLWPARHSTSTGADRCPPMGARFRLKPGFDVSNFGRDAKVVLRGMQQYGLIVADNGSDWYFQGTVDPRWTNRVLDELKRVPARAFQVVDASACKVAPGSARFAYGPSCRRPTSLGRPEAPVSAKAAGSSPRSSDRRG